MPDLFQSVQSPDYAGMKVLPHHWDSHQYNENVQNGIRNGRRKMELLSGHAKALFGFYTSPVICRAFAADEQETEEECNGPCAYGGHHGNGTPIHHPRCSGVENPPVERNDAEFDETQG